MADHLSGGASVLASRTGLHNEAAARRRPRPTQLSMKYLDEYRDGELAQKIAREVHQVTTRPWNIMEVCGGQTHAIVKFGIDELLPKQITLIHGPGCPVCVTPLEMIDKALDIAARPNVLFTSFGDMLRVPGSTTDLLSVKAKGGDVRIVYSPLDVVKLAGQNPGKEVVFFGVGFETTAPATAMAVYQAAQQRLKNFSLLISHVLVPPAMEALLSSPDCRVQGFLAAGHVCTVMGLEEYFPIARKYHVPIVVTGFEPLDILQGVLMVVRQLESGRAGVENQYARSVRREGNQPAQRLIREVFRVIPRQWRGVGEIPQSGLGLREAYAAFDAEKKFGVAEHRVAEPAECISGLVLQGLKKPHECSAFGTKCTPEHPLGATMVSSEGACAAYYRYRRRE
ncbi:MAG TPA: hydrogenase formation protein HypD [Candidatus Sulfopaludibacter sp.]|nr:hydrogenase formation protein HypD [Candidatus Sulfopaludibacter sp.]